MNTMIQLSRSTVLADAHTRRRATPPVVRVGRVGGLDMASRTMLGGASNAINGSFGAVGVHVGQTATYTAPPLPMGGTITGPGGTVTVMPAEKPSSGVVAAIGKTAAYVLLGTMIAGPPAVGYLIAGKIGLAVGAVVAAPMAILFAMSIFDALPQPHPANVTASVNP